MMDKTFLFRLIPQTIDVDLDEHFVIYARGNPTKTLHTLQFAKGNGHCKRAAQLLLFAIRSSWFPCQRLGQSSMMDASLLWLLRGCTFQNGQKRWYRDHAGRFLGCLSRAQRRGLINDGCIWPRLFENIFKTMTTSVASYVDSIWT